MLNDKLKVSFIVFILLVEQKDSCHAGTAIIKDSVWRLGPYLD